MRRAVGLLAAALALATACEGGPTGGPEFVFSVGGAQPPGKIIHSAEATATEAGIRIVGTIGTPDACHAVEGVAVPDPGGVEIRVSAEDTGGTCPAEPVVFPYEGILMGLDPGSYHMIVRHIVRSNSIIAFEGDVEID